MGTAADTDSKDELSWQLDDPEAARLAANRGDANIEAGATVGDRYKLFRRLGMGAVGTVWEAYDQKLDRSVAVKLIRTDCDREMANRFVREAKAAAALRSIHVVAVHDNGVHDGMPYIVMERLEGETVGDAMQRHGRLSVEQVASLLVQCAAGLRCAHEQGIVHRDLKPQNLFASCSDDGYETIKILDFGVAKRPDDDAESTQSGIILGTPHYMSPEQARGLKEVDHRSDLWSIAVILYRALTGTRPWSGEGIVDLLLKICTEPAPPPTRAAPDLSPALDEFFARAFKVEPDERFQSIDELTEAFLQATRVKVRALRDEPRAALSSGNFVNWDSADAPRARLSASGVSRGRGSATAEPPELPIGTLSASVSASDLEAYRDDKRRSRLVVALAGLVVVGAIVGVIVATTGDDPPARDEPAATPGPSLRVPEPTPAPPPVARSSASAETSAQKGSRGPIPGTRTTSRPGGSASVAPSTSPTGEERLPLY